MKISTKRALASEVAKTYDVLGWFAPSVVLAKVLLQRLWECEVAWDDPVPSSILEVWTKWRNELHLISEKHLERCYFPKESRIVSKQLHGFSDASEVAYAGVVYLRMVDSDGFVHVSLVMAKTRVAPIKRLTIPRLELCGANLLSEVMDHTRKVFNISLDDTFTWTDSMVVLQWLSGNPRLLKTFVGNRISNIVELVPPGRWHHVGSSDNPADPASRGLYPSELLQCHLWWDGPDWLHKLENAWPVTSDVMVAPPPPEERKEACHLSSVGLIPSLPLLTSYSSFTRLKRVTAWKYRFVNNCKFKEDTSRQKGFLSAEELHHAELYWVSAAQRTFFATEIQLLRGGKALPKGGPLLALHPFLDDRGLLRVGGREARSKLAYSVRHPLILPKSHPVTNLITRTEHLRLLHAGPTLIAASLGRRYHIIGSRIVIRSIVRSCVTCRRATAKPLPQMMGQLPPERLMQGSVFARVGLDFAGPILTKQGFHAQANSGKDLCGHLHFLLS